MRAHPPSLSHTYTHNACTVANVFVYMRVLKWMLLTVVAVWFTFDLVQLYSVSPARFSACELCGCIQVSVDASVDLLCFHDFYATQKI